LIQYSTCIFSIHLFLDNAYGTIILQASPSKYLIEYERVKNYISLNMNVLKMMFYDAYFVLPNISLNMNESLYISFNMNVLKITNDMT
jgi:hypothetical protein